MQGIVNEHQNKSKVSDAVDKTGDCEKSETFHLYSLCQLRGKYSDTSTQVRYVKSNSKDEEK